MAVPFVKVDIAGALSGLNSIREDQIPFATAKALTNTAQAAMNAVRTKLPAQFRIRNAWTAQGVRFTLATKANPVAFVNFDRYYMYLQEQGGVKVGKKSMIAVPLDPALRQRIPSNMRPRVLLAQSDLQGMTAGLKSQSRIRALTKTYNTGFIIKSHNRLYIAIRTAREVRLLKGQHDASVRILYELIPEAKIPKRLHMYETVQQTVRDQFKNLFAEAMQYAIQTAR